MNGYVDVLAVMDRALGKLFVIEGDISEELNEARAAVAELIEAAKLATKAMRLTTRSGSERGDVAAALGLDRSASLDAIRMAADDHLTVATLTAKGDSATLAKRAQNSAALARIGGDA